MEKKLSEVKGTVSYIFVNNMNEIIHLADPEVSATEAKKKLIDLISKANATPAQKKIATIMAAKKRKNDMIKYAFDLTLAADGLKKI